MHFSLKHLSRRTGRLHWPTKQAATFMLAPTVGFCLGLFLLPNSLYSSTPSTTATSIEINMSGNGATLDDRNRDMWQAAIEGWVLEKNKVLYIAPSASGQNPQSWPFPETQGMFALTGYNPGGMDAPIQDNLRANERLKTKIETWKEPSRFWPAFGFHLQEKWREDGFVVTFEDADKGRDAILELGREFGQAAVYEYKVENECLWRRVVWCSGDKIEDYVMLEEVHPPMNELSRPPTTVG